MFLCLQDQQSGCRLVMFHFVSCFTLCHRTCTTWGVSHPHCLPLSRRDWQAALGCFTGASSSADLHFWRKLSSFISSLGREMPLNCLTATSLQPLGLTHTPRNTVP